MSLSRNFLVNIIQKITENKIFAEAINLLKTEAVDWCRGKNWLIRLPLLLGFLYIFARHLFDSRYCDIFSPLNLGIHEVGHLIFSLFGRFLNVLGGTIFQLFVPVFGMVNFYRQKDFFAIALCFGWLSTSLFHIAPYLADARAMNLPLVAPFGIEDAVHDWNYLLSRMGILRFDTALGFFVRCLAVLTMIACFYFGGWLLWQMKEQGKRCE